MRYMPDLACLLSPLCLFAIACGTPPPGDRDAPSGTQNGYVPQAVFCADGSGKLCGVMPGTIGPDPGIGARNGYPGLSSDVQSFEDDAQTPFDNMAWQMLVALHQVEDGRYVWQGYERVENVFGAAPEPVCPNPDGLPEFSLVSKSDGQPSDRDEEFLQAATNKPLIDRNGNWTVFERRINDIELAYLKNEQWDLTTLAGQQAFVLAKHQVDFTAGGLTPAGPVVGSIELKLAWRILDANQGDDPKRYVTLDALLAIDSSLVRDSEQPICDRVQLGLVGFHIIQKNAAQGVLRPQWIWATFEHRDNAPLSPNACDPVTSECFVEPPIALCTAPASVDHNYSYFDPTCRTASGEACPVNEPPPLPEKGDPYLWSPQQPYASAYLYGGSYGTQVARCFEVYDLTQQLNQQWQDALRQAGSVLSNYMLVGTQWGGDVEPRPGIYVNGNVPAFLSNTTLETYIQTMEIGTCIGCHQKARLAYPDGKTYDANFSFLLGLAE